MTIRVLFYVQHLLGVGHLKRASLIAQAMAAAGHDVTVVLGGFDVQGVHFDGCARIRLPALRATDATFSTLVDEHGRPLDDGMREARTTRLLVEFEALRPDVLLIEQFPFGRRQFRFELMPLLAAARTAEPRPRILCSLRDVLVPKNKPERHGEMIALVRSWFDGVLVHGDPGLIRLEQTLPEAAAIAPMLHYTGYVAEPHTDGVRASRAGASEVIVSAGGGAVGAPLLRAAMGARARSSLAHCPWRLITGPNLANGEFDALAWEPPPGFAVERWRTDMPTVLRNCVLSISQGGYNTVMDILQAKARAVLVPFAAGGQTEQTFRAQLLAGHGAVIMLEESALTPESLARAIGEAMNTTPRAVDVDMNGAPQTAAIVASFAAGHPPRRGA